MWFGIGFQVAVDVRAHDANLLYLSDGVGAPVGTNTADPLDVANPPPSEFEVHLTSSELDGVPGVSSGTTADIYTAMLQDACPMLTSLGTLTLAECRSLAGGVLSFGLRRAQKEYVSMATRLLQAKQDQMDRINIATPDVPIVTAVGYGYNLSEQFSSSDYITFRKLGTVGMWPAYQHVVSAIEL